MNYGTGSGTYVKKNMPKISKLFFQLIPIYLVAVIKNLFTKPQVVMSFLILRTIDVFSLVLGIIRKL